VTLLADSGMGQEGVVLTRVMLEHTIVLHRILERGDDGIEAMFANQSKQMKSWLQKPGIPHSKCRKPLLRKSPPASPA